ncbi:hypothetical protein ACFX13_028129 [Malus domestica]
MYSVFSFRQDVLIILHYSISLTILDFSFIQLAIFLLAFVFLAGAWLGIWAVHKLFLAEDGSIEIMTSQFVNWSIKILGATVIFQSLFSRETTTKALQELASSPEYHRWCSSNVERISVAP